MAQLLVLERLGSLQVQFLVVQNHLKLRCPKIVMIDSASDAHKPHVKTSFWNPPASQSCDDHDFFNLFYISILSTDSLIDLEANLFSFMHEVLQQQTCLFYSNIDQIEDKAAFVLQRGSYSTRLSREPLKNIFPTMITLDIDHEALKLQSLHNCNDINQNHDLRTNFFSVNSQPPTHSFITQFKNSGNDLRCGMLLHNGREIHGVLLYERPFHHPYLNTPLRLQQFQAFLSMSLAHRQTLNYATLDQLTDLHRKYYFLNLVQRQLYKNHKDHQLMIIDIDLFKKFNDTYGHLEGDNCLKSIAKAIKNSLRNHDVAGRFGGEELICLIQSNLKQGLVVAQRIHDTIKKISLRSSTGDILPVPTVSIGIASFRQGEALNQLIERADKALYQAKQSGRNQTVTSS